MNDLRRIACNYIEGTNVVSTGSQAWVILPNTGNGGDRLYILARSRGGRWVKKWENAKRLGHFRLKTIPPASPLYPKLLDACSFGTWCTVGT